MSIAIVATAVPKMPPTSRPASFTIPACDPEPVAGEEGDADRDRGDERRLEADRRARDDVRRGPGLGRFGDLADRPEADPAV